MAIAASPAADLTANPLLEVSKLRYAYSGALAVRNVSITVGRGEIVALVGSNGAGKTTTVGMISGALKPQSGRIKMDGRDLTARPCRDMVESGVTLVPEGRLVFPRMTVLENLQMGAVNPRAAERIGPSLDRVFSMFPRLHERREQFAGNMSGGEQQILAIARGMMSCPSLMILDEPSLGLMPTMVSDVFGLVRRLNNEGLSVLLVEQNVRQSLLLAHRAYVLEKGSVIASGPGREILESDLVRKAYLGL